MTRKSGEISINELVGEAPAKAAWTQRRTWLGTVYHQRVNDVTAFVLAGGKSTRMGKDKAFLELGGETLLERTLSVAKSVTDDVLVVGDPAKFGQHGRVVEDIYPDRGPLGGIHAALTQTQTDFNLVLAVDIPFVERRFLDFLISDALTGEAEVTVPRTEGFLHPLCAIYRRGFAAVSEKALIRGQNKIDTLFASVRTRVIEEEELTHLGFRSDMFRNLNTPEEWAAARAWCKQNEKTDDLSLENERSQ
ncbi:MAG: molybdenum cofactor guanylyltransferase [Terriglobales bacterium]